MRINVNTLTMPGVTCERTLTMGNESHREAIYDGNTYVGEIVYVSRTTQLGTLYGWRPAKAAAQSKLTTKIDAIRRLPHFNQ